MSVPTAKVEDLRDPAQEIVDAAEELIEVREAERGDYSAEDRQGANDEFESTVRVFVKAVPPSLVR